jgi:hypothetical protein
LRAQLRQLCVAGVGIDERLQHRQLLLARQQRLLQLLLRRRLSRKQLSHVLPAA